MKTNTELRYATMKPWKLFFVVALPGMISMFAMSVYSIIEGIFIGQILGEGAFAAVNIAMPLVMINFSLADLIGVNLDDHIYDFKVDDTVQRVSINAYELIDGNWELFYGGGGRPLTDAKGRLMVDFENLEEGLRDAIQSENHNGYTKIESHAEFDTTGMNRATSMLNQKTQILYGQEIPLAVQGSPSAGAGSSPQGP